MCCFIMVEQDTADISKIVDMDQKPAFLDTTDLDSMADHPEVRHQLISAPQSALGAQQDLGRTLGCALDFRRRSSIQSPTSVELSFP